MVLGNMGEHIILPIIEYLNTHAYLGVDFTSTGAWDVHMKNVLDNGRRKVNQLCSVISNRDINGRCWSWLGQL